MKTTTLFLLTVLVAGSCKKGGIPTNSEAGGGETVTKQNCFITEWANNNGLKIKYGYDANKRIISESIAAPEWYELPTLREFIWKSDRVTVTESPKKVTYDLILTDNIVSKYTFLAERYSTVTYNKDGYITKISDFSNSNNSLMLTKEFKYTGGNLTSMVATLGIGTSKQNVETYTVEYYSDKKAIEGVDLGLNKFILPDWDLSDTFSPFQLPTGLFGKPSANLLKSVTYILGKESFYFVYDFDANGKVTNIKFREPNSEGGNNITTLSYNCNN